MSPQAEHAFTGVTSTSGSIERRLPRPSATVLQEEIELLF
jgi:hypothetical protein